MLESDRFAEGIGAPYLRIFSDQGVAKAGATHAELGALRGPRGVSGGHFRRLFLPGAFGTQPAGE